MTARDEREFLKTPVAARIALRMVAQPSDTTCGPACLKALYDYYGDDVPLDEVVRGVRELRSAGTLAVFLACHALRRGYRARIYTYNLTVFDPTWFVPVPVPVPDLADRLRRQSGAKDDPRLRTATEGYLEFLSLGGELRFEDLTAALLRKYLSRSIPILTGLSSTYLYRASRESGARDDDVRGAPAGHFVVLSGYERERRIVHVADPLHPNPLAPGHYYDSGIDRVLCAILLGVLTHDANMLIVRPSPEGRPGSHGDTGRR
jgi:hypothetical protein